MTRKSSNSRFLPSFATLGRGSSVVRNDKYYLTDADCQPPRTVESDLNPIELRCHDVRFAQR
jgi:hypothetical protein